MPIFIKALPLSFSTFWRYLIVLPFLGIGAMVFSLLSIIPLVGWLVPGMVSVWLSIAGLRCALLARGYTQPLSGGTILTASFYFSVIFLIIGAALKLIISGIIWAFGQAEITLDMMALTIGVSGQSLFWSGILISFLAPVAITSIAFAVPLTAAAAATGRSGWDHKAFAGFGRGAFGLSIVMVVWMFSGHIFSFFGEVWTVFGLIVGAVMALAEGESIPFDTDLAPWTALRGTLIMAWASSWYFATAVLTWEHFVQREPAKQRAERAGPALKTEDIRDLRRARMQKKG